MVRKRKTYICTGMILFLLLYAYFAKWFAKGTDNILLETVLQLSRHLIHIGLILAWIFSCFAESHNQAIWRAVT